jgi:Protein of unknown function (DUF3500)
MNYRIVLLIVSTLLLVSLAFTQDTTSDTATAATVAEDGTITVAGLTLPGQGVTTPTACEAETTQTAKVLCAAEAFLATLTEDQKAEVLLDLTQENAVRWSNFPTPFGERNGIRLSTLETTQQAAAEAVVKTAMGSEGYSKAMQIRMADDVLNASGGMQGGGGTPPSSGQSESDTTQSGTTTSDTTAPTVTPPANGGGGGGGYSSGIYTESENILLK